MLREITFLDEETTITISSDRNKIRPWGVFGGKSASTARCILIDSGGNDLKIDSKATMRVKKDDTITTMTSGGGGWGDPFKRDPEQVRWDVLEGLVSVERARIEYGVVFKDKELEIDKGSTEEIRFNKGK